MTVMDAVDTATTGIERLYQLNAVPPGPTYPYGTYFAGFGRADGYTLDARHGGRWGRVVVQVFGRTVDSVNDLMERVVGAVLDQQLAIDGWDPTPCRMELDPTVPDRDPDHAGVLSSTATFTFTATAQEA